MRLNHASKARLRQLANIVVLLSLLLPPLGPASQPVAAQVERRALLASERIETCGIISSPTPGSTLYLPLVLKNASGTAQPAKAPAAAAASAGRADFSATPQKGLAPFTVIFANTSLGQAPTYLWNFGDGATSADQTPTHIYTTAGVYSVTLTATGLDWSDKLTCRAYIEVLPDNQPPSVSITTPAEEAIVGSGLLQVTGVVTDDGAVTSVQVNDIPATLTGNQFNATVSLAEGNQTLNVVAQDSLGALGFASRVVRVDGSGPMISIQQPSDRQAVYTLQPDVYVQYTDFYSPLDLASFSAHLTAETGTVTDITSRLTPAAAEATGTLSELTADTVYTLTVSIADALGNLGSDTSTFYVPPDPGALTPPAVYTGTGWLSGQVYDSSTCNEYLTTCQPLRGVQVTLRQLDHETRESPPTSDNLETKTSVSGPDGFFAFPVNHTGVFALRLEKDGYIYGQREVAVVRGKSTATNALYLTPLDTAVTDCESAGCHHASSDGMLTVDIPPGALPAGETIQVTATNFEQVEFLPSGDLPPGTGETYAFNLSGASETSFARPVTVTLQNYRGFPAGTEIPLGYWNQNTLQWEHEGLAVVEATGQRLVMTVQHFSNHDPNYPIVAPGFSSVITDTTQTDCPCCDGDEGSFINVKSGNVREWVQLPTVNVLGEPVAPTLAYNTSRAQPSEVIDLQLDFTFEQSVTVSNQIQFELYIEGRRTDQFTFTADTTKLGEIGRYRYLWDGRNMLGEQLPPGIYAYAVKLSVAYIGNYCRPLNNRFGNPPDCSRGILNSVSATRDDWTYGTIELNTQIDNSLGQGWVLKDQQRLIEDEAGRLLVSSGDRLDEYYFEAVDQLKGLSQNRLDLDEPPVTGPAAEVNLLPPPTGAGTPVSGTITADTTWTLANSPYLVTGGNVVVTDGVTLNIEPGVTVRLDQYKNLRVDGELQAIGTAAQPITFTAYNSSTYERWDNYPLYDTDTGQFARYVDVVAVDSANQVWVAGTNSGYTTLISRFRPGENRWQSYHLPSQMGSNISITDLAPDSQGRLWVATNSGAAMLSADGLTWTLYQTSGGVPLISDSLLAVAVAPDGMVWFGAGGGANRYNPDTNGWTSYRAGTELPANADVYVIAINPAGEVWLGTSQGLCRLTVTGASCPTYNNTNVIDLAFDQTGHVWAVVGAGVGMLTPATGEWVTYTVSADGLVNSNISSIAVDTQNRKWIGYTNAGVSLLSSDNQFWFLGQAPLVSNNEITDLAVAPDGSVWVGAYKKPTGGSSAPTLAEDPASQVNLTWVHPGATSSGTINNGYWGTLQIGGGANLEDSHASRLSHVRLEGARVQGLYLYHSTATLDNLTIIGTAGHGLAAQNSPGFTLNTAQLDGNTGSGLYLQGGAGVYTLTQVTARANTRHGLYLDPDSAGQVSVTQATLAYNQGYGIFAGAAGFRLTLQDSAIEYNAVAARLPADSPGAGNTWTANRRQQIEWNGGSLSADLSWPTVITDYVVLQSITVPDGVQLTIPPGASVLFDGTQLNVEGRLSAVGTPAALIYFGPLGAGYWSGISLGGGSLNDSDASTLSYLTIKNANAGLALNQSRPTLSYLNFARNYYGLSVSNSSGVAIRDSNFVNNTQGVLNNTPAQPVDARHNYWGSATGPRHTVLNPSGTGDPVSDGVTFFPWRGAVLEAGLEFRVTRRIDTDHAFLDYAADTDSYVRYMPDGTATYFDAQGYQTATIQVDGRQTLYTYNLDGSVATMAIVAPGETSPHWVWNFAYAAAGKLQSITDPAGQTTTFTVDQNGQLTRVSFPDDSTRRFYYDPRGLLTQQVDGEGGITSYTYDQYGRLSQHLAPERTIYNPVTGQTTRGQEVHTFAPSDTAYPLINTSPTGDPAAPAPAVLLSASLSDRVNYDRGGFSGYTNQWGNWVQRTDALNHTTTYTRDRANNLTGQKEPAGNCTQSTYAANGNRLSLTELTPAQCALPAAQRDPAQMLVTYYTYEPRFNQLKTQTDKVGNTTLYTYDYETGEGSAGRLVQVDYPARPTETGAWVTPTVQYTYNLWGLRESVTDERGKVTRYVYTQGTPAEAAGGSHPLFAPGVTPVPGLLTQIIADDGGAALTTTYREFNAQGQAGLQLGPGNTNPSRQVFDALGRVISQTNGSGITYLYEYDGRGNLVRRVDDYTADGVTGRNQVTEYTYAADGQLTGQRTQVGTQIIQAQQSYDLNGLPAGPIDPAGNQERLLYDAANQQVGKVDALNQVITYTHDWNGRLVDIINSAGTADRTEYDGLGRTSRSVQNWQNGVYTSTEPDRDIETRYQYDSLGRTLIVTDTLGRMTHTFYASNGQVLGEINNWQPGITLADCASLPAERDENICKQYAYNVAGQTVIITDTLGRMTRTFLDSLGRVEAEVQNWNPATLNTPADCVLSPTNPSAENICTVYTYDAAGNQATVTNALGQRTLTVYDVVNRPIINVANWDGASITSPSDCAFPPIRPDVNLCTMTTYNREGWRSSVKDPLGHVTEYGYDSLGRQVTVTQYLGAVPVTTTTTYDAAGNQIATTDPLGHTTFYVYDKLQRLVETISPAGVSTSQGYNALGQLTLKVDGLGNQTRMQYDLAGRLVTSTDASGNVTRFAYDGLGNRVAVTDANLVRTRYDYDNLNRLVQVIQNDTGGAPTADSNVATQYALDAAGRRLRVTNGRGYVTEVTVYDMLDRAIQVQDALSHTTTTAYTALGQRLQVTDANTAVTQYTYDGLGRLISVTSPAVNTQYAYNALGVRTVLTDSHGVTTYAYDDLNRLTGVSDPLAGSVGYTYDLAGNRTHLVYPNTQAVTYTYDVDNRLAAVTDWNGGLTTFAYDAAGRLVTTNLPNGVVTTQTYDNAHRLLELTHATAGGATLLAHYGYTLDGVGNRVQAVETLTQTTRSLIYTYDKLNRLKTAAYSTGASYAYTYDAAGNRLQQNANGAVTNYQYDAADRLTLANGQAYTWDNNGNLLNNSTLTNTWDTANRLTEIQQAGHTLRPIYNGSGDRVGQTLDSQTTYFALDITGLPEVLQTSTGETYLHLPGVILARSSTGNVLYLLPDGLGSVRQAVNGSGQVVQATEYDPYGQPVLAAGSSAQPYGFAGEWWQTEVELLYLRARWYAPEMGRFFQLDPSRQEQNLYLYAQANPVNYTDPSGLLIPGVHTPFRRPDGNDVDVNFLLKSNKAEQKPGLFVASFYGDNYKYHTGVDFAARSDLAGSDSHYNTTDPTKSCVDAAHEPGGPVQFKIYPVLSGRMVAAHQGTEEPYGTYVIIETPETSLPEEIKLALRNKSYLNNIGIDFKPDTLFQSHYSIYTLYAHLENTSAPYNYAGKQIYTSSTQQFIGYMGDTGLITDPTDPRFAGKHLHLETRVGLPSEILYYKALENVPYIPSMPYDYYYATFYAPIISNNIQRDFGLRATGVSFAPFYPCDPLAILWEQDRSDSYCRATSEGMPVPPTRTPGQ